MADIPAPVVKYDFWLTAKKVGIQLLIWGLPQLVIFFTVSYPSVSNMTIGGGASLLISAVVDWLKHK